MQNLLTLLRADEMADSRILENSLRQLLNSVGHNPSYAVNQGVIFDIQLDEVRYILTCAPSSATQMALSPREREIVRLVARGFPNKAIALALDISPCTVATHLRRIFTKLGVNSRAEMVACVFGKREIQ